MKALIFDIYKGTTHDGPGMRDTVFFKGCPLSCKWCHNPEGIAFENSVWYEKRTCIGCGLCFQECKNGAVALSSDGVKISKEKCVLCGNCVEICPAKALSFVANEYTVSELTNEILKDKEYFKISGGGVTASGGEAMCQYEFVYEFFSQMKNNDIHTALDTTGFCDSHKLFKVLSVTDTVLYDLKMINSQLHKSATGVDNKIILENLIEIGEYIKNGGNLQLWIRTPIIPEFTDNQQAIEEIALFIKNNMPTGSVEKWELCAFNNSCTHKYQKLNKQWQYSNTPLIKKETLKYLKSIAEKSDIPLITVSGISAD